MANPLNLFAHAMLHPTAAEMPFGSSPAASADQIQGVLKAATHMQQQEEQQEVSPTISRASSGTGIGGEDSLGVFTNNTSLGSPGQGTVGEASSRTPSPQQLPFPAVQKPKGHQSAAPTRFPTAPMAPTISPPVQFVSVMLPSQAASHHMVLQPPTQLAVPMMVPPMMQPSGVAAPMGHAPPAYPVPFATLPPHAAAPTTSNPAATTDYGAQWRKKHGAKKTRA